MPTANYLAVDVGSARIGLAVADDRVRIACPLETVAAADTAPATIAELARQHRCQTIVVGYPRNQAGEPTGQTQLIEEFAGRLGSIFDGEIVFQDESLTSVMAEERLRRGKRPPTKAAIDAEAACIILTDYLEQAHG